MKIIEDEVSDINASFNNYKILHIEIYREEQEYEVHLLLLDKTFERFDEEYCDDNFYNILDLDKIDNVLRYLTLRCRNIVKHNEECISEDEKRSWL